MALDPTTPRSRRALLTAAAAATAVTVVEAVARPLPVAAGPSPLLLGVTNTTTVQTTLTNSTNDATVLKVDATMTGWGIQGTATDGIGVLGIATSGKGDANGVGVAGEADRLGVWGSGGSQGVSGFSVGGVGVVGTSKSGIGVRAHSDSGQALHVEGKIHSSRSGKATVTAGHRSVTATVPGGLGGTPLCFANLSSYRVGVAVAAVRPNWPSSGKIRIYLTRVVTRSTSVSWMVMD